MTYVIVCALALSCWGILNGQVQRLVPTLFVGKLDSLSVVGQTVPVVAGGTGAVSFRDSPRNADDTLAQTALPDTLELHLLQIQIKLLEVRVEETSFWTRLIPRIHLSASFGMHDLVFIDPASFTPYILPRDSYRLTISLSLNDVLVSSSHTQAILELEKLREMMSIRQIQHTRERKLLNHQLHALQDQLESLEKELAIVQELLRFNQLRFEQGKIEFDALARTKLELLGIQRAIQHIQQQQAALRLKLCGE